MAKCEPLHALLSKGRSGNAIRRPCSARTEEREISRTVRGDVSIVRLHRSSFSGITLSATKGHTLFLNTPGREHDSTQRVPHMPQLPQSSGANTLRKPAIQRCMSETRANRYASEWRAHVDRSVRGLRSLGGRERGRAAGDVEVPKASQRLRCSRCGGKSINTRPAWHTTQRVGVPDYRRPER